jgi:NAD(P)-dependent dehydrogenase (short-subunit alcohol dehydrogenase family)
MPNLLVTGGARRIGAAIARAAAAAGHGIVIHHNTAAVEAEDLAASLRAAGGQAWTLGADLADADEAAALCGRAAALCGGLDALVNNASLFLYDTPGEFDVAQFQRHTAVNLLAPALLIRGFARQLAEGTQGCVVNMLDNRLYAPNPDYFTYALGKYGLAGMTEMAALHYARASASTAWRRRSPSSRASRIRPASSAPTPTTRCVAEWSRRTWRGQCSICSMRRLSPAR